MLCTARRPHREALSPAGVARGAVPWLQMLGQAVTPSTPAPDPWPEPVARVHGLWVLEEALLLMVGMVVVVVEVAVVVMVLQASLMAHGWVGARQALWDMWQAGQAPGLHGFQWVRTQL